MTPAHFCWSITLRGVGCGLFCLDVPLGTLPKGAFPNDGNKIDANRAGGRSIVRGGLHAKHRYQNKSPEISRESE